MYHSRVRWLSCSTCMSAAAALMPGACNTRPRFLTCSSQQAAFHKLNRQRLQPVLAQDRNVCSSNATNLHTYDRLAQTVGADDLLQQSCMAQQLAPFPVSCDGEVLKLLNTVGHVHNYAEVHTGDANLHIAHLIMGV